MNRESELKRAFSSSPAPEAPAAARRVAKATEGRTTINTASAATQGRFATLLTSDDGMLSYTVMPAGTRLFIQRTQRCRTGSLAVQCLLIKGRDEFGRWCAGEPIRFANPLLFDRLRRCGNDVFDHAG
jgi:hypothetical protein